MELIIIDLEKENLNIESLYTNLPRDIQKRVDKYKKEDDWKRSVIAWSIVNNKLDLTNNQVVYNEYGKPFIDNYYFSISHSHNLVGVLFSSSECGLDIELVTRRYDKIASKILNEEEIKKYIVNPDILIKKWTMIEAYGKGLGIGFRFDLIEDIPNNVVIQEITDCLNNKYYYSIWIKK